MADWGEYPGWHVNAYGREMRPLDFEYKTEEVNMNDVQKPEFKVGDLVEAKYKGKWHDAVVTKIDTQPDVGNPYQVEYTTPGPSLGGINWVGDEDLRPLEKKAPELEFKVGDIVEVLRADKWYLGRITKVYKSRYVPYRIEAEEPWPFRQYHWPTKVDLRKPVEKQEAPAVKRYPLAVSIEDARKADEDLMVPLSSTIHKYVVASPAVVPVKRVICREYECGISLKPPVVPTEYWEVLTTEPGKYVASGQGSRKAYEMWAYEYRHRWLPVNGYNIEGFRLLEEPPRVEYETCLPTLYEFLTKPRG